MCQLCLAKTSPWNSRRGFLLAAGAAVATPALAQVDVGKSSTLRNLVPAGQLEQAAVQQYGQLLAQAKAKNALAPASDPRLVRLREIARKLIPFAAPWNERAAKWQWEINLIGSNQVNAFCMPGGKIAFYTGIMDQLQLTDDEAAMVMGHEMAHALREHARARVAKSQGTGAALSVISQIAGLGRTGDLLANAGTHLLTLKFSRDDEVEADLVGLELAARGGYDPQASVALWQKMAKASGGGKGGGLTSFLSTHPTSPDRITRLQANVPKVQGLYEKASGKR